MQQRGESMNKKQLWEKFMSTGKVSDYLSYKRADNGFEDDDEVEFSEEFYHSNKNLEDYNYDPQDRRYRNP